MTVRELVQSLRSCEPEAPVVVDLGGAGDDAHVGVGCVHDRGATVRLVTAAANQGGPGQPAEELYVRLFEDGEDCQSGLVHFPDWFTTPFLRAALVMASNASVEDDGRGVLSVDDGPLEGRFGLLVTPALHPCPCFVPDGRSDRLYVVASAGRGSPLRWLAHRIEVR